MDIPKITLKSTLMSSVIFWSVLTTNGLSLDVFPFIFLSLIPIFIICLIANLITIAPFFSFSKNTMDNDEVFKIYFPYYAIFTSFICVFFLLKSNLDIYSVSFFSSAYFTSLQSWIWFGKANNTINTKSTINESKI